MQIVPLRLRSNLVMLALCLCMCTPDVLLAQDFGLDFATELQTNLKRANWVNQLRMHMAVPLGNHVRLQAATVSVGNIREQGICNDLQIFSNLDADNLPLALTVAGMEWHSSADEEADASHSLFLGIRNMNEDYFISDVTSLFINSSCGIFPTIGCNYPIANYPVASVGMHYAYRGALDAASDFQLGYQFSLYNGVGYNRFAGRDNVFRFCPDADGLFALTQVEYQHRGSQYFLGAAMHYGELPSGDAALDGDVPSDAAALTTDRAARSVFWTYAEQRLTDACHIIVGYSHAFDAESECLDFAGVGAKYDYRACEFGLFTDYARFSFTEEWATELTCKVSFGEHYYLQPALHFIVGEGDNNHCVALFRLGLSL